VRQFTKEYKLSGSDSIHIAENKKERPIREETNSAQKQEIFTIKRAIGD
jgi:hypothetical protein